MAKNRQHSPRVVDEPPMLSPQAPMFDSLLAILTAPLYPYTKHITHLITRKGKRDHNAKDILVPAGYAVDVVATDLNCPIHCTFDESGFAYVSEGGYKIGSPPRILKIDVNTGEKKIVYQVPQDRWVKTGALTGSVWHQGALYFMNAHTLSRLNPNGSVDDIVTDLPGLGDHQANHPVVGPDGKIYFGIGTATNTGVVGDDNFAYGWLSHHPEFHDYPGRDITLTGRNYEYRNVLGDVTQTVKSGAYVAFGTETTPGQVIKGRTKCNGSVLRVNPDGSDLELVCWGLRNPYGLAFSPDGRLFASEHDIDERSRRFIIGDPHDLYEIQEGAWYGWPDYASGIRLDDPYWGDGGRGREPVIADPPDPHPPKPWLVLEPHNGANGLDFCRDDRFGFEGDAFIACTGDVAPITTRPSTPRGFKVLRIDMQLRQAVNFAVNKIEGPASKLPHEGFERPSHCQFGPDGALYVVDWGQIELAPGVGGIRMKEESGTLWRIRRTEGPRGGGAPNPITLPFYALQVVVAAAGMIGFAGLLGWRLAKR